MTERIRQCLHTSWLGNNIIYEAFMDSTNLRAKALGKENVTDGTIVVTEQQTAGRGRRGRDWVSPQGNCYFSLLLRPSIRTENASRITLVAALALAEMITNMSGLYVQIKWPNDIVVNGKKLCGILTESSIDGDGLEYVVVGIGINVNQETFDVSIEDMATSIALQTGRATDCARIIGEFLNCFEQLYEQFVQTEDLSALMERYNDLLVSRNQEVRIIDQNERVTVALGINESGELLVRDADGNVESILSGEVSVRGLYGYV